MELVNVIGNIVKAIFTSSTTRKSVTLQANNIYTTGYQLQKFYMATPYGYFGIPKANANGVFIPINGSAKALTNVGFINSLPANSPIDISDGEFAYASDNWALVWNNDGLRANKLDNDLYSATLISGEWVNYLMSNRITEIENMISQINANYTTLVNDFNSHTHLYIPGPGPGTTPTGPASASVPPITLAQTALPVPGTLAADQGYINAENDLLNDNATVVP